ncbi:MAG: YggS family pyridoxal phosphate-dependent enzyme [Bacteroidetes bacterium]|nr:YggS family pyridoxal phosphate-dependent enzyme [Bacteroidota bacterium]
MGWNQERFTRILAEVQTYKAKLIAVSKLQSIESIGFAYESGQRDFGENYVQELLSKHTQLPTDINWHFIGHLQSNKVKYIVPFVSLIHGVDSEKLLAEISKQGKKISRTIPCLLQVHIASEETKFGLDETELDTLIQNMKEHPERFSFVALRGLMGMASFTEDNNLILSEFKKLKSLFEKYAGIPGFTELSMGMSADYRFALQEGSTMVRIGSMLFGSRA